MGVNAAKPDDIESITRNLRNLPVTAPIRTKYIYNNMMYSVAAHIVETKTGLPFSTYLEDKIFSPLKMDSSHLYASKSKVAGLGPRIATGYSWPKCEGRYRTVPCQDIPEGVGAGNIITSVNDGIKWIQAMLNCHSPVTKPVRDGMLKPRTICEVDQKVLHPFSSPHIYAAGWECSYYQGHAIIEHTGGESGFSSISFFLPGHGFGGVVYGNSADASIVSAVVARDLIDELLRVPADEQPDWNQIESEESDEAEIEESKQKKE
jgi:CubicO group peptidase (beta-lactamase class C family)